MIYYKEPRYHPEILPKKHIKIYHALTIHSQTNIKKHIKQKLEILNHPLLTQNYHSSTPVTT